MNIKVFSELSKDIKLKLQGLWKSQSSVIGSRSQIAAWAKKEGVEADKVLAFIKHLQIITGSQWCVLNTMILNRGNN